MKEVDVGPNFQLYNIALYSVATFFYDSISGLEALKKKECLITRILVDLSLGCISNGCK